MSKPRRDSHYLADILDAIRHILEYTADLPYDEYLRSRLVQDAVLRNFQVIGEAIKKLSPALQADYPAVP